MTLIAAEAMPFERARRIRFSDCDPAGIVFFPQYFVMFNGLVEDFITEGLGISYAGLIAERRIGLPIVRLETDFSAVSRLGDEVVLGLAVERVGSRSLSLRLGCRAGSEARVRARHVLVSTDLDTHRARPLPDDLRAALGPYITPTTAT